MTNAPSIANMNQGAIRVNTSRGTLVDTAALTAARAVTDAAPPGANHPLLTHVNLPTAHKEPQLSFGGIKQSGTGLPEAGKMGIEFFTQHKVVYVQCR